ncbi:hypothetical protein [Streptomyces vinaceus]|uniref:hypothetical protein n=1 Tax=Streptomyces vinaceus TaxID=1960 RepID=UPI00104432CF|nr:hypothetical protein [Streptomyces vinaceus]
MENPYDVPAIRARYSRTEGTAPRAAAAVSEKVASPRQAPEAIKSLTDVCTSHPSPGPARTSAVGPARPLV